METTPKSVTLIPIPRAPKWHSIVAWRSNADLVEKFVHKGSQIFIEGKLRTRQWTDQTGNKRFTTEVQADNIQLLGKRPDAPQGGQPASNGYQGQGAGYQGQNGYQSGYQGQGAQGGYSGQSGQSGYQGPGAQGGYAPMGPAPQPAAPAYAPQPAQPAQPAAGPASGPAYPAPGAAPVPSDAPDDDLPF